MKFRGGATAINQSQALGSGGSGYHFGRRITKGDRRQTSQGRVIPADEADWKNQQETENNKFIVPREFYRTWQIEREDTG